MTAMRATPQNAFGVDAFRGTLGLVLRGWKYRGVLAGSSLAYWLLYAFSSGMVSYYSFDVTPYLKGLGNPYFVAAGPYYSGLIWFPSGHLQVNLLYGPTFFSLLLSVLFGLNVIVLEYGIAIRTKGGFGLSSLGAFFPALFSGGCCAVPLGVSLFALFVPTSSLFAITAFTYNYVILLDSSFAVLMVLTLAYSTRRAGRCRPRQ